MLLSFCRLSDHQSEISKEINKMLIADDTTISNNSPWKVVQMLNDQQSGVFWQNHHRLWFVQLADIFRCYLNANNRGPKIMDQMLMLDIGANWVEQHHL